MRFLKKKIALAMSLHIRQAQAQYQETLAKIPETTSKQNSSATASSTNKKKKTAKLRPVSESYRATKNIVKNYGRAISAFALSSLALPYLDRILEKEGLTIKQFTQYIKSIRGSIDGLNHFRSTILIEENDLPEVAAKKQALIAISKVFIKYFSVNWIFNSRVFHKEAHLKFRFKMLRRIQNPKFFTYLRGKNDN